MSDNDRNDPAADEARRALGREIADVVSTLALIRQRCAQQALPVTEGAAQLLYGLDLACNGGRRLTEELATLDADLYVWIDDNG